MVPMKAWRSRIPAGNGFVSVQNPSGSKHQDKKKRFDLSRNEEILELSNDG